MTEIINKNNHLDVSVEEAAAWQARLATVANDDAALLALAHEATAVPLKIAALEALTSEKILRQAMHDLRDHDKRVYRAAKMRWETMHGRRVTTEQAQALIASAKTLAAQDVVPVNRVVELDQAWAELDRNLIDAGLLEEYVSLGMDLAARVRTQGEHGQAISRWLTAVDEAMNELRVVMPSVAVAEIPPEGGETKAVSLMDLTQAYPGVGDKRCDAKAAEAAHLLALASSVVGKAKFLHALPAVADAEAEKMLIERWREFPEVTDPDLHTTLSQRFADWRNASVQTRQAEHDARQKQEREQRSEEHQQRVAAIQKDVEAAEAAQAGGHVAELAQLLAKIDNALKHGAVRSALSQRIDALHREHRRLQEWQRWSGEQGRDKLVSEAQVLAEAAKEKVSLKAHAEAIDKLRERWKELDKLGATAKQAVWHAFDNALTAAHAPVAAHLEKLKAQREENLAARVKIVDALKEAAAKFFPAVVEGAAVEPAPKPDWRAVSHALEEARVAWRKLGPVEHTVPRKSLKGGEAITKRFESAVAALESPLKGVHDDARGQRQKLIAAAKELVANAMARDTVDKVKRLQTQWQSVAKSLPLPRRDENALWMEFKTATDGIFAARDATRAASEAEANAKVAERAAVIDSVSALARGDNAAEIKRALAEADKAWRAAPEAPKPQVAKLDARYRAARDAAAKRIAELTAHVAQARYDALAAAMALCDERESNAEGDWDAKWSALTQLPDAWRGKLETRFKGGANADKAFADWLLNLEVACSLESPPEFQAARQQLKIRALKVAMEGRQATVTTPADIERWLIDAAAQPRPDAGSRERLSKILAVVKRRA